MFCTGLQVWLVLACWGVVGAGPRVRGGGQRPPRPAPNTELGNILDGVELNLLDAKALFINI